LEALKSHNLHFPLIAFPQQDINLLVFAIIVAHGNPKIAVQMKRGVRSFCRNPDFTVSYNDVVRIISKRFAVILLAVEFECLDFVIIVKGEDKGLGVLRLLVLLLKF
jgi:hypothetical protein